MARFTEGFNRFVTSTVARLLPAGAVAGWDFHPLESATFSRRTPEAVTPCTISSQRAAKTFAFGNFLSQQAQDSLTLTRRGLRGLLVSHEGNYSYGFTEAYHS